MRHFIIISLIVANLIGYIYLVNSFNNLIQATAAKIQLTAALKHRGFNNDQIQGVLDNATIYNKEGHIIEK